MTDLAKLVVRLEAQTGQYQAQLERAQSQLQKFDKAGNAVLGHLGGILASISFVGLIKGAIDAADHMGDLAQQTGLSVEALSQLQYAADQSGTDLETLTQGLRNLSKTAIGAQDGTGDAAVAFKALGVSVTDSHGALKDTETLLGELADGFSKFADGPAKAAAAQRIFGKSGTELIPFLNQGRAGIEALRSEFDSLGLTMSTGAAKAASEFNNSIKELKAGTTSFLVEAVAPLLPVLTETADAFFGSADGARDLSGATAILQTGLKLVVDFGLSLAHTFTAVGRDFGALAAAAVSVAKGEFGAVGEIFAARREDGVREDASFQAALDKLWADGAETRVKITEAEVAKTKDTRKQLVLADFVPLKELKITEQAGAFRSAMDTLLDNLKERTQTSAEQISARITQVEVEAGELLRQGGINQVEYSKRVADAIGDNLDEIVITPDKLATKINKMTDQVNEFARQAARNTQDIIADTILHAFDGGLKELPKRFAQMLLELAVQAQAAKLAEKIFGPTPGQSSGTGFLGTIGSLITGLVGPGRAGGGSVVPGTIYPVNENTPNSEWFAPASAGTIIPAGAMGGGMSVVQNFNLYSQDGKFSKATQAQVGAAASRGLTAAGRKNN